MDDNPKSRGRKHVFNKSKYNKNKPKPVLPQPSTKSKALIPNWDRYEEELSSRNEYVPVGSDFTRLANAPISKGSHFQFKSETTKIQDVETSIDTSGLFNIDLNLIGLSLSTIPFNERCGIPENNFSISQLNIMNQTAKNNTEIYEQSLKERGIENKSEINNYFYSKEPDETAQKSTNEEIGFPDKIDAKDNIHDLNIANSILEEILEKSVNKAPSRSEEKKGPKVGNASSILETESLQQWLDDVLGD